MVPSGEREVVGDRGVVGDQHVDGGQHRRHVAHLVRGEHHDARKGGGAAEVFADPERMRPDQQHRIGQIEVCRNPLPLQRSRYARIAFAIPPGRGVQQHAASGELVQRQHRRQRFAGSREPFGRRSATQHVVARIPGDHHPVGGQPEGLRSLVAATGEAAGINEMAAEACAYIRRRIPRNRWSRAGCQCAAWPASPGESASAGCRATTARRTHHAPRTGWRRRNRG